jgi:glutaredoxin 3
MSSKYVDQLVNEHSVVIFSQTKCPFSQKAKNVLSKYNLKDLVVVELDLKDKQEADAIKETLEIVTGAKTTPRVFLNGNFIGGGDDIEQMDINNKLHGLLENSNALKV